MISQGLLRLSYEDSSRNTVSNRSAIEKKIPQAVIGIVISFLNLQSLFYLRVASRSLFRAVSSLMVSVWAPALLSKSSISRINYDELKEISRLFAAKIFPSPKPRSLFIHAHDRRSPPLAEIAQDMPFLTSLHVVDNSRDNDLIHLMHLPLRHLYFSWCTKITGTGLSHLSHMTSLETLHFDDFCCNINGFSVLDNLTKLDSLILPKSITNTEFSHVSALVALKNLNFFNCDAITDVSMQNLSVLTALETLELSKKITDSGMLHLSHLTNLHALHFWGCEQVTDLALSYLSALSALRSLSLPSQITDRGLSHLSSLRSLENLTCHSTCITGEGLSHLIGLTALRTLNFRWGRQLTDTGLSHLSAVTTLRTLSLSYSWKITDTSLSHLSVLTDLRSLDLTSCNKITDRGMVYLRVLSNLTHLDLSQHPVIGSNITDNGLQQLSVLTALESVNFSHFTRITGVSFHCFNNITSLKKLNLSECPITDEGLFGLSKISTIEHLELSTTSVTDDGLHYLSSLSALKYLSLYRSDQITDIGLLSLISLHSLQHLKLRSYRQITGMSFCRFSHLTDLKTLEINGCPLTDKGLSWISKLPSLEHFTLYHEPLTDATLSILKQRIPPLKLAWYGKPGRKYVNTHEY